MNYLENIGYYLTNLFTGDAIKNGASHWFKFDSCQHYSLSAIPSDRTVEFEENYLDIAVKLVYAVEPDDEMFGYGYFKTENNETIIRMFKVTSLELVNDECVIKFNRFGLTFENPCTSNSTYNVQTYIGETLNIKLTKNREL